MKFSSFVVFPLLALLGRCASHRGYVIHNFCVINLHCRCCSSHCHSRSRKPFVQMLFPLKFMDQLASNVYVKHPGVGLYHCFGNYDFWSVIVDVLDIRTDQMFKCYLPWSLCTNWLQIFTWGILVWVSTTVMDIIIGVCYYRCIRHYNKPDFPIF